MKCIKNNSPQLQAALKKEALIMMRVNSLFVRIYGMLAEPLAIIMELVDHVSARPPAAAQPDP